MGEVDAAVDHADEDAVTGGERPARRVGVDRRACPTGTPTAAPGPAATPKYVAQAAEAAVGVSGAAATVDADPIMASANAPPTTIFFTVQTSPGG